MLLSLPAHCREQQHSKAPSPVTLAPPTTPALLNQSAPLKKRRGKFNERGKLATTSRSRPSPGSSTALPLPRLGLPPRPVPRLERRHARLAHLGVPRVEGLQLRRLHHRRQLHLGRAPRLGLAVRRADQDGQRLRRVQVREGVCSGG